MWTRTTWTRSDVAVLGAPSLEFQAQPWVGRQDLTPCATSCKKVPTDYYMEKGMGWIVLTWMRNG